MSESMRLRKIVCELRCKRDDLIYRQARLSAEIEEVQQQINRILEEREIKSRERADLALQQQTLLADVQKLREDVKSQIDVNHALMENLNSAFASSEGTMDNIRLISEEGAQ